MQGSATEDFLVAPEAEDDVTARVAVEADPSDLSGDVRERLREKIEEQRGDETLLAMDDEAFDLSLGFLRQTSCGILKPTVCGLLMIGRRKRLPVLLPTARSIFQRTASASILTEQTFCGPIVSAIEELTRSFEACSVSKETCLDGIRIVIPDYSRAAFREALVNAFCHRDYRSSRAVCVRVTENSLIITNPGGFLPGIPAGNLLNAKPRCRNALLARALKRTGYAGGYGRGIETIFLESMRGGRLWPDYGQSTEDTVRVEILKSKEEYEFFRLVNRYENRLKRLISVPAMTILAVLRNVGPELSLTELRVEMPGGFPKEEIRAEADKMVADGVLAVRGDVRDPRYRIAGLDTITPETPSGLGKTVLVMNRVDAGMCPRHPGAFF